MNRIYYIYERDGYPEVAESLEDIPEPVDKVGVFMRQTYLKRKVDWKETT